MTNPYGDVELDAQGMRALAHPVRLRILTLLQREGPSTATALSPLVGATPSVASWHLRHLAKFGLVHDLPGRGTGRDRWWAATGRGFRVATTDEEGYQARQALAAVIAEVEGDLVATWEEAVQPRLELEWRTRAGRSNTTVLVTPGEADQIRAGVEALLAPYVLRKDAPDDAPRDARLVRLLWYVLPGLADPANGSEGDQ